MNGRIFCFCNEIMWISRTSWCDVIRKALNCCGVSSKIPTSQSNHEKSIRQAQSGKVLQGTWSVLVKNIKAVKDKDRLRNWQTGGDQGDVGPDAL